MIVSSKFSSTPGLHRRQYFHYVAIVSCFCFRLIHTIIHPDCAFFPRYESINQNPSLIHLTFPFVGSESTFFLSLSLKWSILCSSFSFLQRLPNTSSSELLLFMIHTMCCHSPFIFDSSPFLAITVSRLHFKRICCKGRRETEVMCTPFPDGPATQHYNDVDGHHV